MVQGIHFIVGSDCPQKGRTIGIYTIESPTGAVYVGQSHDIKKRWGQYRNLLCRDQQRIYNSLKKHGPGNHSFKVQMYFSEITPQSVLDRYEDDYINLFKKSSFSVMNLRGGGSTGKLSEETKKKISESNKGKVKLSLRGIRFTAERIANMKIIRAKQVFSESDKIKISQGLRRFNESMGRKPKPKVKYPRVDGRFSEIQRVIYSEQRSGDKNQFFGKKHTEETKQKLSDHAKKRVGDKNPKAKSIIQYDLNMNFIKEYSTINQAATELNISRQSINCCCGGWRKTAHGYIWKYKTPKKVI